MSWKVKQKLAGVFFLLVCVFIYYMAMAGVTVEDRDGTPILLFGPLGLYLLFTEKRMFY